MGGDDLVVHELKRPFRDGATEFLFELHRRRKRGVNNGRFMLRRNRPSGHCGHSRGQRRAWIIPGKKHLPGQRGAGGAPNLTVDRCNEDWSRIERSDDGNGAQRGFKAHSSRTECAWMS